MEGEITLYTHRENSWLQKQRFKNIFSFFQPKSQFPPPGNKDINNHTYFIALFKVLNELICMKYFEQYIEYTVTTQ